MSKSYRRAKALDKYVTQLNALFPGRNKISDGWIGNAEHAARNSDHNPWVHASDGTPVVTAEDITNDPNATIDCAQLAEVLVRNKDNRIKYLIFNRQICSSEKDPWVWRPYTGLNAHKHHLHLSVKKDEAHFDDMSPWILDFENNKGSIENPGKPVVNTTVLKLGSKGPDVKKLQSILGVTPDGDFGALTELAVKHFQSLHLLKADGIVGPATFKELGE